MIWIAMAMVGVATLWATAECFTTEGSEWKGWVCLAFGAVLMSCIAFFR